MYSYVLHTLITIAKLQNTVFYKLWICLLIILLLFTYGEWVLNAQHRQSDLVKRKDWIHFRLVYLAMISTQNDF